MILLLVSILVSLMTTGQFADHYRHWFSALSLCSKCGINEIAYYFSKRRQVGLRHRPLNGYHHYYSFSLLRISTTLHALVIVLVITDWT